MIDISPEDEITLGETAFRQLCAQYSNKILPESHPVRLMLVLSLLGPGLNAGLCGSSSNFLS